MRLSKTTLIGLGCALACALCVGGYLMSVQGEVEKARAEALARFGGEQVEVLVATRDMAAGETVESSAVASKLWVADLLPQGALTNVQEVKGRQLGSAVYAGEVLCERRFDTVETTLDVPAGMSAISVPAQAVQSIGGLIKPGMRLDMYATGATSTEVLVEGAVVLASNLADSSTSSSAASITLAIKPSSVQEVVAAAQNMELYFVLPASEIESNSGDSSIDEVSESSDAQAAASSEAEERTSAGSSTSSSSYALPDQIRSNSAAAAS